MARKKRQRIGEILVEWGVVTPAGVEEALAYAKQEGQRIGEALSALGYADEEDVTKALARQFDMEYIDLDQNVDTPSQQLVPDDVIRKHNVLPLGRENGKVKVAITDPLDLETLDMLRFRLNMDIEPCLASKSRMKNFLDRFMKPESGVEEAITSIDMSIDVSVDVTPQEVGGRALDLGEDSDDAPILRLVNKLIAQAVKMRASDIHIEPMENRVRVRFRVDGVCIERDNIPKRLQGAVVNRFKLMAGMDLAEKRVPQDGRIKMTVKGADIDFRVSALPSYHGESVVLRILRPESARMGITALGFEQSDYERFQKIIRRPNGIFLVTGPTGSGKTTTLYGALNELNRPDRKIITAEDPVEYKFTGINQVQINESIGLTFAATLRSMLRQAPNIILVGEIRDYDVAEVAIQAALTGHLVFSTLHTNDAPSAITRLVDMGVKPFLVASSVQAIMAQRLVRVICPDCKEEHPSPEQRFLKVLGYTQDEIENTTFYRGSGCSSCNGSGYRGRQGIFELMEMTPSLRELAFNRAPLVEIRKAAVLSGMRTLLGDGKDKVRNGITTVEELMRITQAAEVSE